MLDKPSLPYGVGFRSLTAETPALVALPVTGTLPSWLTGTLLRTGPSKFEVGDRPIITGSTDGDAAPLRLRRRRRHLCQPFPQGQAFCAAQATARFPKPSSPPTCRTCSGASPDLPEAHRQWLRQCRRLCAPGVAFTETAMPMRFSPDTLETLGVFGYRRALKGQVSTAHPHHDTKRAAITATSPNSA